MRKWCVAEQLDGAIGADGGTESSVRFMSYTWVSNGSDSSGRNVLVSTVSFESVDTAVLVVTPVVFQPRVLLGVYGFAMSLRVVSWRVEDTPAAASVCFAEVARWLSMAIRLFAERS